MYFEYLGSCKKKLQKLQKLALVISFALCPILVFNISVEIINYFIKSPKFLSGVVWNTITLQKVISFSESSEIHHIIRPRLFRYYN